MPPLDGQIINQIRNIKRVDEIPVIPFEKALEQMNIEWIHEDADEYYLNSVSNLSLGNCENNKKLGVVFTPLHGQVDVWSQNCLGDIALRK
ncbi:MAG: hypothetical protein CM1200mP28_16300 [Deltaproteobacteria bacterium]|nr:MAG: hypothetical protein CM1200mP28_16300 [Deltaproteobacteria bacterium]